MTRPVDYRRFSVDGKPYDSNTKPEPGDVDRRWWRVPPEQIADSITATLGAFKDRQANRAISYGTAAKLYGNISLAGPMGISSSRLALATKPSVERVTFNVVQSVIDTVAAMNARNRPRPMYLTDGGDYREQRRAKLLNRFVDGLFYENAAHDLGEQVFRDGCVCGDGLAHVFLESDAKGKPVLRMERALAFELWIDEIDAIYSNGHPRQLHRVRNVDRAVVVELFPEQAEEINLAPAAQTDESGVRQTLTDMVTVRESWHLPSGLTADDGLHALSLDGVVLGEPDEWKHDFFPFARFQWNPRQYGYWGQGLAEQLQGHQLHINALCAMIQKSITLGATFKVWAKTGARIVLEHLNNDIGAIIRSEEAPEWMLPPLVQPEIYEQLRDTIQRAFQQAGISQLSASSVKPAGVDSGKALRTLNDIESDRFQSVGHRYERFFMDLARMGLTLLSDASRHGSYVVRVPGRHSAEVIDLKDIGDLSTDSFVMQCFPVSSLPNDPAGRLQTVQEYAQAGYLSPRQAKRLLDFPDLGAEESLDGARETFIAKALDYIVDHGALIDDRGQSLVPEPFDDLAVWREMTLEYYARGKTQGLEEDRLELLRRVLIRLDELDRQANPPPDVTPPGAPMPPPISDLIPNVNGAPSPAP